MDPRNFELEDFVCDESFQRHCRGEGHKDAAFWQTWIADNPDRQLLVIDAKRLFNVLSARQGNVADQLAALKEGMVQHTLFKEQLLTKQNLPTTRGMRFFLFNGRHLSKYAASILVLLAIGGLGYMMYGGKNITGLHNYEYYTTADSHKTVILPDSSMVVLNGHSHLSISKNFDSKHREVSITGEAYFDIKRDAVHPFVVHTNQYTIRVLGTTFNVKSYPGQKSTETSLLTGKVEITSDMDGNSNGRIILKPSEKYVLKTNVMPMAKPCPKPLLNKGEVVKLDVDTLTHYVAETSWVRMKMEIADESFDKIAQKLESWYGIKIIFADEEVKHYRYTASLNDETILKTLQYFQQSFPFTYKVEENSIVIARN